MSITNINVVRNVSLIATCIMIISLLMSVVNTTALIFYVLAFIGYTGLEIIYSIEQLGKKQVCNEPAPVKKRGRGRPRKENHNE